MTTCSPLSETSRAGIALSAPAKNRLRSKRLDEVVEMMAERNLRGADFGGDAVQHAAAKPRAERARAWRWPRGGRP